MQEVLNELFYANINPNAKQFTRNNEYGKAVKTVRDCEEKLLTLLSGKELELFEKLMKAHGESNFIHGRALCPDCDTRMRISNRHDQKYKEQNRLIRFLSCARYGKYGTKACSMHSISYELLSEVVRQCINQCIEKVHINERKMLDQLLKQKRFCGYGTACQKRKNAQGTAKAWCRHRYYHRKAGWGNPQYPH